MVLRTDYLKKLERLKDRPLIKILTGLRRSGKSTLLEQFARHLQRSGVPSDRVLRFNLERGEYFEIRDYRHLYDLVASKLRRGGRNYVFIDEVQNVEKFEKALDALFVKDNVDLYVTGSNARLLSGELATLLSGRHVELPVFPFSFKEYLEARGNPVDRRSAYARFVLHGALPYLASSIDVDDTETMREYLLGVFNTVLLKDIVQRLGVKSVITLEDVARFMFDNIGNMTSIPGVAASLTAAGRAVSVPTAETYVRALCDSFVLYPASRYDVRGKAILRGGTKYYLGELGFRSLLLGGRPGDVGRVLENEVYIELLRRGHRVSVGKVGSAEVDFVTIDGPEVAYYQVAATVRDEKTLRRELAPLQAIRDSHPKFLITLDDDPSANFDGIQQMNALEFLQA